MFFWFHPAKAAGEDFVLSDGDMALGPYRPLPKAAEARELPVLGGSHRTLTSDEAW